MTDHVNHDTLIKQTFQKYISVSNGLRKYIQPPYKIINNI